MYETKVLEVIQIRTGILGRLHREKTLENQRVFTFGGIHFGFFKVQRYKIHIKKVTKII